MKFKTCAKCDNMSCWIRKANKDDFTPSTYCRKCTNFRVDKKGNETCYWQDSYCNTKLMFGTVAAIAHCSIKKLIFCDCCGRNIDKYEGTWHEHDKNIDRDKYRLCPTCELVKKGSRGEALVVFMDDPLRTSRYTPYCRCCRKSLEAGQIASFDFEKVHETYSGITWCGSTRFICFQCIVDEEKERIERAAREKEEQKDRRIRELEARLYELEGRVNSVRNRVARAEREKRAQDIYDTNVALYGPPPRYGWHCWDSHILDPGFSWGENMINGKIQDGIY